MAPYSNSAQNSPEAAATTTTTTIIINDPHQQRQQVVVDDDHRRREETSPAAGGGNHHKLARRKKRLLHQQQQTQWVCQAIKWKKRRLELAISGTEMMQQDNNNNCIAEEDEDEALDIFQPRKVASLSEPSTPQSCSDSNPITATTTTTATRASATNVPPSGTAGLTTEVRIPSCPSASSQPSAGGACSLPDMASSDQPNSPAAGAGDTSAALLGRRLLGSLLVSLPDGTILECRNATTTAMTGDEDEDDDAAVASPTTTTTAEENIADGGGSQLQQQQRHRHSSNFLSPMGQNFSNFSTAGQLSTVCRPGHSLLALLHGKGAQTLLLNAFCGHSRRRMYARLKWSDSCLRACELLCEFSKDPQSVSRRLASIQLFCVQSANNNGMPCADAGSARLTFTTRHNASGALIYLDSASIPLLGHFPSEITGKSLFALVHPEDAQRVRDAHQQLHATGGVQIVRTPALRLAAYAGHAVTVDAEWAAFVNPWTSTVEMVVGRHTFVADGQNATAQQQHHHHQQHQQKPINNMPTGKNVILQSADESAADTAFLQELFMKHVPAAQPSPPMPNAVVAVCQNEMPKMAVMVKQEEPEVVEMDQQHHQQQQLKWKANNTNNQNNNNGTTTGNELSNGTSQVYLSYNQINCLENVHRLLKSQSSNGSAADGEPCGGGKMPADSAPPSQPLPPSKLVPSASPPYATTVAVAATTPSAGGGVGTALTRELLQLHDQRWEERCRAHWRRRLSQQTTTVVAASPRCHQTQQQQKQKRPLSQEQPGNFASRSPPGVADWHHHPQQHHHHVAKLARCRSEQRRSAWPMQAAVAQFEDELSPLHAVPPSAAGAVVAHNEQPPCGGALPPTELIALIAAVLQNVPPPSPPAETAKIGIVASPPIMNDSNGTPLGLHPQLLDQLLQAAASARNTLNARLLKQDSNNNQHNSSTSCSNNI